MAAAQSSHQWAGFFAQVNGAALASYPSLLFRWFPTGGLNGNEFECGDLTGAPGKSFKVNIHSGLWSDFATNEGGGDPVSLYAAINHLKQGEAGLALGRELGIEPPKLKAAAKDTWKPIVPIPDDVRCDDAHLPHGRPDGAESMVGWLYLDAADRALTYRVRFNCGNGKKEVWPLTWCRNSESGALGWRWRDLPAPWPLFNLEKLAARPDAPVLIVEGEVCADAADELLGSMGWVAVTWPGGSKRVKHVDWKPLAGRKVWIWPDNDDPGKSAALTIAEILSANKPLIVRPDPSWSEGYDIANLAAEGWTGAKALSWIEDRAVPAEGESLKFKRQPVDLSTQDLDIQTQAVWEAVAKCNVPPSLFASPYGLMVVDRDLFGRARQRVVDENLLRNWLVTRMAFTRTIAGGHQISTHPSDMLLTNLIIGRLPLKILTRVTEVPVFAIDGRLISREGFDEESGIYYLPGLGLEMLEFSRQPTDADVSAALETMDDLLCDFPFMSDCDRTHALAFGMLPLVRALIKGRTPLFRFEAPSPGTGKSMLMRLLAYLTAITITDISPTEDEEEWRKRITAALSQDPDAILIDNAQKIESAHLKKLLTDDVWEDRALGTSRNVRYPVRASFGVSLNNPMLSREMIRRSVRVRLDARCERPEQRSGWRHGSLEEYAREHRGELVEALVTLARYGLRESGDISEMPTLGSFEAFSRRMGGIMRALHQKGFLGDREDNSMLSTEETAAFEFVQKWAQEYPACETHPVSTKQLLDIAEKVEGFYLGRGDSERARTTSLGMWLSKHRGFVFGGWRLPDKPPKHSVLGSEWILEKVSKVPSLDGSC